MDKEAIKILEKIALKLHKRTGSFRTVAQVLDIDYIDVVYLLKADEETKLKRFESKVYNFD